MANSVSHASLPYPIKNARYTLEYVGLDADGDPTDPTTPDTEVSQDGGSFADAAEEVTTITGSNGAGYITLTGAEMNNSLVIACVKVASGPKATVFSLRPRNLAVVGSGTLSAGSAGGGTLGTLLAYDVTGCFIRTTGGTGGGGTGGASNQARRIITYNTSTGAFTVSPNWETTPDNTTTYDVLLPEGVTLGMLKTLNPATAGRTLVVDSAGLADANMVKMGPTGSGTAQTARDIGASVLLSSGTGTGQLDFTSGVLNQVKLANAAMGGSSLNLTLNNLAVGGTATFTGAVTASNASNSINLGTDAINATVLSASAVSEMQSGMATASALSTVQADTDDIQTRLPTSLGANGNMKADVRDFSGTAGTFSGGRPEVLLGASQNATTFASLTVTGRLQVSDGIDVSCSTAHRNALVLTGNGSGAAARMVGGSGGGNVLTMLSGGGSPTAMIYVGPGGLSTPGLSIDVFGNAIEARSGAGIGIWAYGATAGARFENTGTGPAVSLITPDGHGIDASTNVVGGFGIKGTIDGAITNSGLAPASTALSTAQWTNTRAGYLDKLANLPTDPADASDIAALFATLTSHGDSTWATATGFAVAGDSMALTTTERNNVAAVTLRRSMANVEAAAVGDTLTKSSLYGSIQQAQRSNTTDNVGSLTIYKTGGTELGRLTLATASSVDQITGVS